MPYATRDQALAISIQIGCPVGAHQVGDQWNPCRSEAEYLATKKKKVNKQSFSPPQTVRNNARRGLRLREEHGRGGLSTQEAGRQGIGSGVARARNLANGDSISLATIRRMRAFFERHEQNNRPGERAPGGGPTAGTIAWLLWGGNAGRAWANRILREQGELDKSVKKVDFQKWAEVKKVDEELGIVFGWAIVCKIDNEEYVDLQGDHIPEDGMLIASAQYMEGERLIRDMHEKDLPGKIIFAFPLTEDISKSLGIQTSQTGLIIGMKPGSDEILAKFKSGEYTGFSIGGVRLVDE